MEVVDAAHMDPGRKLGVMILEGCSKSESGKWEKVVESTPWRSIGRVEIQEVRMTGKMWCNFSESVENAGSTSRESFQSSIDPRAVRFRPSMNSRTGLSWNKGPCC